MIVMALKGGAAQVLQPNINAVSSNWLRENYPILVACEER
jgi:hypothetical protein